MGGTPSSLKSTPVGADPPPGITPYNDAVWELYKIPDRTPNVEIIFFHGLQYGDYENAFWKTWLARNNDNVVWPKSWLGKVFPRARILSISYNSSARSNYGQMDMYALGENLVSDIIMDHHDVGQSCPVILVGHCLDGIVIKQFLLSAGKEQDAADQSKRGRIKKINSFLGNFKGVFYYATPHVDSKIPDFAKLIPGVSDYIKLLETIGTERERINEEFRRARQYGNTTAFAIAESLPTSYAVRPWPKVDSLNLLINGSIHCSA